MYYIEVLISDEEIKRGWLDTRGQGNRQARSGEKCVFLKCTEEAAVKMSREFYNLFRIASCCYYDGEVLFMYYGDAGVSGSERLKSKLEVIKGLYEENRE